MKTKITSPKIPSTKNLYGKASWMEVRFDDLMRKIEKKKRVSKVTGKVTLSLDQAKYESIIDCIERAMSVFDRIVGLDSRKSPAVQK